MCTHVYMCVCMCISNVCVDAPEYGDQRLLLGIFLGHSALYLPTQGLLLSPELAAPVTSQLALQIPCVYIWKVEIIGLQLGSPCFMQMPRIQTQFLTLTGGLHCAR